jgi:hypothetical protein
MDTDTKVRFRISPKKAERGIGVRRPRIRGGRIHGPRAGLLTGFSVAGDPLVEFRGNLTGSPVCAHTTAVLSPVDAGKKVLLMFEDADPAKPIIMGVILERPRQARPGDPVTAQVDGDTVLVTGDKEIVLQCGEASITLTRAGKVLIRGTYLMSRSSGTNRIKGGSVQIN